MLLLVVQSAIGCARSGAPEPFSSDGCSLFPDGTVSDRKKWCDCCFAHDIAYWRGGTSPERRSADLALRDCVKEKTGNALLAETMYGGVRVGGHPAFPTWYRWGYGWPYGRGFEPLTEEERVEAEGKLDTYFQRKAPYTCDGPGAATNP